MFGVLKKFFRFSGKENSRKFKKSIVIGLIDALAMALKIPAIMCVLMGVMNGDNLGRYIWTSVAIMSVSIIISLCCKMSSTMLQTEGGYNTAAFKRIEMAEHLRYVPMGYFNKNSIGEIASVTTNTMENLSDVATRVVMLTTQGLLETAMIILMILLCDWRIALVALAGVAVFILVNTVMQNAGKQASTQKVECDTELIDQIMEYIQGISEVKSYNLIGRQTRKLNAANEACAGANVKMEMVFVPYHFLQNMITKLTGAVIIGLSAYFYINGSMTASYAIGMSIAAFLLYGGLETMGSFSSLIHVVNVCVDKANAILGLETMDIDGREITPENYDIEVKNIEFSYDGADAEQTDEISVPGSAHQKRKIIDGISLFIPEKTTTAIVGPSGGGKTTLCNLVSRFWDVDSGEITLGGVNVKDYSMNSLMNNFSFVFQNVYLFEDTIENNIKFGRPEASHEEVVAAAKKACCHDFISRLPEGYNTVIGEGGATLSGGEKQRISIARAIMKDSPIIILDEATANVDPENEKELTLAVEALTKEKTIIMIAHRLKTVRHADQIVVVDHGRIAQQGTHEELMKQDGIYRRFVDSRELAVGWKL